MLFIYVYKSVITLIGIWVLVNVIYTCILICCNIDRDSSIHVICCTDKDSDNITKKILRKYILISAKKSFRAFGKFQRNTPVDFFLKMFRKILFLHCTVNEKKNFSCEIPKKISLCVLVDEYNILL